MAKKSRLIKALFALTASLPILACHGKSAKAEGLDNQVPSCYVANKIKPYGPSYSKLLVVMIDQTVLLDKTLQDQVLQSINALVQPGTRYVIGEFSAFSQGRYLNIIASGVAEAPIPKDKIGNIPIIDVQPFNACMKDQLQFAKYSAEKAAYKAMSGSTSTLNQSDILMAMKEISAPIKAVNVKDKVMLLVSDGLENSSVTSFYARGTARNINPQAEMQKVENNSMLGDFGGAKVYVIGGAESPPKKSGSQAQRDGYRDPQMQVHLKEFWTDYFKSSDADLVAFGEPAILSLPSW